jgi:FSR family fosmidomycin resistance protein-like MFS transporter
VVLALVMDRATEHHSVMNGIYMTIVFVSGSITALAVGGMADWLGLVNTYKVAALLAFLAIPFVLVLAKRIKRI